MYWSEKTQPCQFVTRASQARFVPALLAFWSSVQAQTLNKNLLTNPGAEDGGAVTHHSDPTVAGIPGWTTTGGFSVGYLRQSRFFELG